MYIAGDFSPLALMTAGVGFWWIPLIIAALQYQRQQQAQREIEQAEESQVAPEQAQVSQELLERQMGNTSAAANQRYEPRRQFEVARRVRRARDILQTPTVNPATVFLQDLARRQGDFGQGAGGQQFDPTMWYRMFRGRQLQDMPGWFDENTVA